jgi:hypothetical protein
MCCTVPFDFVPDLVDDGWNELRGGVGPWSLSVSVNTNDHCFKEHRKSFPAPRARRLIIGGKGGTIRKEVYKGGRFISLVFFCFGISFGEEKYERRNWRDFILKGSHKFMLIRLQNGLHAAELLRRRTLLLDKLSRGPTMC